MQPRGSLGLHSVTPTRLYYCCEWVPYIIFVIDTGTSVNLSAISSDDWRCKKGKEQEQDTVAEESTSREIVKELGSRIQGPVGPPLSEYLCMCQK